MFLEFLKAQSDSRLIELIELAEMAKLAVFGFELRKSQKSHCERLNENIRNVA